MSSFFECFNNFVQSGGNVAQNVSQEKEQIVAQQVETEMEILPMPSTPTPSESVSVVPHSLKCPLKVDHVPYSV